MLCDPARAPRRAPLGDLDDCRGRAVHPLQRDRDRLGRLAERRVEDCIVPMSAASAMDRQPAGDRTVAGDGRLAHDEVECEGTSRYLRALSRARLDYKVRSCRTKETWHNKIVPYKAARHVVRYRSCGARIMRIYARPGAAIAPSLAARDLAAKVPCQSKAARLKERDCQSEFTAEQRTRHTSPGLSPGQPLRRL